MAVRIDLGNASIYLLTLVLFGFWVLLSGRFDAMHLAFGLGSALLVSWFSRSLAALGRTEPLGGVRTLMRLVPYVGWLIYQIIIANIDVARRAISPRLPIYPGIIKVTSRFDSDLALTALANSITLTPGTMTVDVVGKDLYIHCLAIEDEQKVMEVERDFEEHVERLFGGRQ
jgi:multicomponent Na+:H+ antiporter subunit E